MSTSAKALKDIIHASWFPFSDEPLLQGPWYTNRLSNPFVLYPQDSVDDKWHLFCHSWLGIHHFVSESGISWTFLRIIEIGGKYPSIFIEDGVYYLLFEKRGMNIPFIDKRRHNNSKEHHKESRIEIMSSTDLSIWSKPRHLISSSDIPVSNDFIKKGRLSHPHIVSTDQGYRLYIGASVAHKKLDIARYTVSAISVDIVGTYQAESNNILVKGEGNDYYRSLASGQLQVQRAKNVYRAVQCAHFFDEKRNKRSSAILLLESDDGLHFTTLKKEPILSPPHSGWASSYILTSSLRYKEDEGCWYCYFSAATSIHRVCKVYKESIGLLIGKDPRPRKIEDSTDVVYRKN